MQCPKESLYWLPNPFSQQQMKPSLSKNAQRGSCRLHERIGKRGLQITGSTGLTANPINQCSGRRTVGPDDLKKGQIEDRRDPTSDYKNRG